MRRYQVFILGASLLSLIYIVAFTLAVSAKAAEGGDLRRLEAVATTVAMPTMAAPEPGQSVDILATQVFLGAAQAVNAAEDAQRYAQDAADEVSKHLDTTNDLLGLFQNVTAIVGVLIPILAVAGGYLGFNQLNEAQKDLETARLRFEKEVEQKSAELEKVREDLEQSAQLQRENSAKASLSLSLLPLGERQYRAGDYGGAVDAYKRALELDPDSVVTHYRLGYVYTQSGNLEQAQAHLERALELENNFAPALACLGYVYRRMGEKMDAGIERNLMLDQASTLLLKALQLSPRLLDDDNESWWGSLGGLYRRRNQVDEAIEAYQQAAVATPHSSYAFSNLALLYARKENVDAMLRMYERVEELAWGEVQGAVDNYWGFADLLTARLALGKVDKAEEALAAVVRTAPVDSPYVFESLLDTLHRLQKALGPERSAHMGPFIDRIQARLDEKSGPPSAT